MTYGYEVICEKPFRKISERTKDIKIQENITILIWIELKKMSNYSIKTKEMHQRLFDPCKRYSSRKQMVKQVCILV